VIETIGLCAGYQGRDVLRDVSLSFTPGQVTALLGPNGCGKSTLLRTILGLHPRTSGQILVDGTPLEELSPRQVARRAAYLAQSRSVPNITALRLVLHGRFPYLSYPRHYRKEDLEAARRALCQASAEDLADSFLPELSGGQRQKVYLAMALAQDTESILMDEPTTYLDVAHQLEVMEISRRLAREGRAVVLVLHDLCLALRTADQVVVLAGGRVRRQGSPEELCAAGVLQEVFDVTVGQVETPAGRRYYVET
jgi:iron complex transport system ATP-binding protein